MTKWLLAFSVAMAAVAGVLVWLNTPIHRHPPSAVTEERVRHLATLAGVVDRDECRVRRKLGELRLLDPAARQKLDGWGRPLWMHCVGNQFEVRSAGEDGELHTTDDIVGEHRLPP